jgi:NAD(P)-dependent dehydrogenase (short-subunit alcohol dehydrogenase family)
MFLNKYGGVLAMMRFSNKVALVTGGGQGIGRATALRFAQEGADVVVTDIRVNTAEQVVKEIRALGRESMAVAADVTEAADNQRMIKELMREFGHLDVVFSNAGVSGGDVVAEMTPEVWDQVINVNLRGVFLTCKYSIPALVDSGGGAIVNMGSSMAGWDATEQGAAYMASKEGVTGLTKSLALQLGGYGIRVNAICPGVIKTRLSFRPGMSEAEYEASYERFAKRIPTRRVGQPEDVAAAVAFLASDDARHITGSMLLIDGGQTLQSWSNAPDEAAYPLFDRKQP